MFLQRTMASYYRLSTVYRSPAAIGAYVRRLPEIPRPAFGGGGESQGFRQLLTLPYLSSSRHCSSVSGRTPSIVKSTTAANDGEDAGFGGGSTPPPPTPPVDSQPPPSPKPQNGRFSFLLKWGKWIIGWMLGFLPFWRQRLSQIEGSTKKYQVEEVLDVAETVVDATKVVAEVVEDISSEIADQLPEEGKLKDVFEKVEEFSKLVGDDLEKAKEVIDKVDDFREGVETILEEPKGVIGKD